MVYLKHDIECRYTILVGNPQIIVFGEIGVVTEKTGAISTWIDPVAERSWNWVRVTYSVW